jgi:hypothetical protein
MIWEPRESIRLKFQMLMRLISIELGKVLEYKILSPENLGYCEWNELKTWLDE